LEGRDRLLTARRCGETNNISGKRYIDHWIEAGFECSSIKNSGAGAAMIRVEAARRAFPRYWFNETTTEAGRDALIAGCCWSMAWNGETLRTGAKLVFPEVFEPIGCQSSVADPGKPDRPGPESRYRKTYLRRNVRLDQSRAQETLENSRSFRSNRIADEVCHTGRRWNCPGRFGITSTGYPNTTTVQLARQALTGVLPKTTVRLPPDPRSAGGASIASLPRPLRRTGRLAAQRRPERSLCGLRAASHTTAWKTPLVRFSGLGRQDALASIPGALRPRGRPILQRRDPVPHFGRRCQVPVQGVHAPILGPGSGSCSGPRFSGAPAQWRDAWQFEHVTGKYVISDNPMTEEQ
jgi:hypothetical protein